MTKCPNQPASGNGARAFLFHSERLARAVPEPGRWVAMRRFSAVLLVLMLVAGGALGADRTNELTLFKHQGRRQAYEWRISEARVAATPKWNMDRAKVPVAPEKAWRIAKDWFKKQGELEADFVRMEIRPFVINSTLSSESRHRLGDLLDRYYYRIECIPAAFDSMLVVVLMDGTVLEPVRIAHLPLEEIK